MELHTFISETLSNIITGIKGAQSIAIENKAEICPSISGTTGESEAIYTNNNDFASLVKFDIALSTNEDSKSGAKAGIFVTFAGVGANLDEAKGTSSHSRVQFEIPVVWPKN